MTIFILEESKAGDLGVWTCDTRDDFLMKVGTEYHELGFFFDVHQCFDSMLVTLPDWQISHKEIEDIEKGLNMQDSCFAHQFFNDRHHFWSFTTQAEAETGEIKHWCDAMVFSGMESVNIYWSVAEVLETIYGGKDMSKAKKKALLDVIKPGWDDREEQPVFVLTETNAGVIQSFTGEDMREAYSLLQYHYSGTGFESFDIYDGIEDFNHALSEWNDKDEMDIIHSTIDMDHTHFVFRIDLKQVSTYTSYPSQESAEEAELLFWRELTLIKCKSLLILVGVEAAVEHCNTNGLSVDENKPLLDSIEANWAKDFAAPITIFEAKDDEAGIAQSVEDDFETDWAKDGEASLAQAVADVFDLPVETTDGKHSTHTLPNKEPAADDSTYAVANKEDGGNGVKLTPIEQEYTLPHLPLGKPTVGRMHIVFVDDEEESDSMSFIHECGGRIMGDRAFSYTVPDMPKIIPKREVDRCVAFAVNDYNDDVLLFAHRVLSLRCTLPPTPTDIADEFSQQVVSLIWNLNRAAIRAGIDLLAEMASDDPNHPKLAKWVKWATSDGADKCSVHVGACIIDKPSV